MERESSWHWVHAFRISSRPAPSGNRCAAAVKAKIATQNASLPKREFCCITFILSRPSMFGGKTESVLHAVMCGDIDASSARGEATILDVGRNRFAAA